MEEKKQVQPAASKEKYICKKIISAITTSPDFRKKIRPMPPRHGDDSGRAFSNSSSSSLRQNKLAAPSGTVSTGFSKKLPKPPPPPKKTTETTSSSSSAEAEVSIIFITSTPPPPPQDSQIFYEHASSPAALPTHSPAGPTVSQPRPQKQEYGAPKKSSPTSAKEFMESAKAAQENTGKKQAGSPQLLQGKGEDKASRRPIAAAAKNDQEKNMSEYTEGGSRNIVNGTSSAAFDRVMSSSLLRNDSFNDKVTAFIIGTKNKFHNMSPDDEN